MSKCIIHTMVERIVQGFLGTAFVAVCSVVILAIPLGIIKAAILLLGERVTALLGLVGFSVVLIAAIAGGLVKLYREAKEECK